MKENLTEIEMKEVPGIFDLSTNQINPNILSGPNFFGTPLSPNYTAQNSVSFYTPQEDSTKPINNKVKSQNQNTEKGQLFYDIEKTFKTSSNIAKTSLTSESILLPEGVNYPKLQNIVSTANLKCLLELREIALKAKNAEYNPKRFAAVIMRIKEPKTTALIFASGKMVCTGAKSEEDSKKATRQYAKIIQKLGYPVKFSEFKIQNIVASCDVKFPIRLEGLASNYLKFSTYEPEMFPGLIFHMASPKIVLLIFVSGKIVLTGAKNRNDIYKAYQNIYPVLQQFRKKEINGNSTELSINEKDEEF